MILTPPWGCGTLITSGTLIKDSRVGIVRLRVNMNNKRSFPFFCNTSLFSSFQESRFRQNYKAFTNGKQKTKITVALWYNSECTLSRQLKLLVPNMSFDSTINRYTIVAWKYELQVLELVIWSRIFSRQVGSR